MSSSFTTSTPVEPNSAPTAPPLIDLLATIPDHRHRRGIRHNLHTLLAAGLAAVAAGATSYAVLAEWIADPTNSALADLGIDLGRRPSEPTLRRAFSSIDANLLDQALGAWMWTTAATVAGRRIIAIDGKTVRGARSQADPNSRAPHLVAALDHASGTVLNRHGFVAAIRLAERPSQAPVSV